MVRPFRILGVYRETEEAGKPSADKMIADEVARVLREGDHDVSVTYALDDVRGSDAQLFYSMARSDPFLDALRKKKAAGKLVVNDPDAVYETMRKREEAYRKLRGAEVPIPDIIRIELSGRADDSVAVVKRPDRHGQPGDTQFLSRGQFDFQGWPEHALLLPYIRGDSRKMYGIGDTIWLPDSGGLPKRTRREMKACSLIAGTTMGLDVYGGDFIVTPGRDIYMTDVNDWPSCSPIRTEAASAIAELLMRKAREIYE